LFGGSPPAPKRIRIRSHHPRNAAIIDTWLQEALAAGYVTPGRASHLHPIFAIPKSSGGWRVVVDLRSINAHQLVAHFKLPNLKEVAALAPRGAWAAKIDLRDFFHHVELHKDHQRLCGFTWRGRTFRYTVLPFGSATSPWTAVKVFAPVLSYIRSRGVTVVAYIDDLLIIGNSLEQARAAVIIALEALSAFGYQANLSKSQLEPSQVIQFLGMTLHFDRALPWVSIPGTKARLISHELSRLARRTSCPAKVAARVAGLATSVKMACPLASTLSRRLLIDIQRGVTPSRSWNTRISLRESTRRDLAALADLVRQNKGCLLRADPPWEIHSDASLTGLGAILKVPTGPVVKEWASPVSTPTHINVLELRAALEAVKEFTPFIRKNSPPSAIIPVTLRCDSRVALSYILRGTGRIPALRKLARRLALFCHNNNIMLFPKYIPGCENYLADLKSRMFEHAFSPEIAKVLGILGPSSMPFPRTTTILKEMDLMIRLGGTLVTPCWPGAPWAPVLAARARQMLILPVALTQAPGAFTAKSGAVTAWNFSSRVFSTWTKTLGDWSPPTVPWRR
jgi:hypothetical protein